MNLESLYIALEQHPNPCYVLSKSGEIVWANRECAPLRDAAGEPSQLVIQTSQRAPAKLLEMWDSLLSNRHWTGELTLRDITGELRHFATTASPLPCVGAGVQRLFLFILSDMTTYHCAVENAMSMATRDKLTGLFNRAHFDAAFDQSVKQARRMNLTHALLLVDLDGFKRVNDTFGHDVGDQVLVEAARRIRASVRESDVCARIGGDEFACVLAGLKAEGDAGIVASKIVEAMRHPIRVGQISAIIGASIGIAGITGKRQTAVDIFKEADDLLYSAKKAGRGCWRAQCAGYPIPINIMRPARPTEEAARPARFVAENC